MSVISRAPVKVASLALTAAVAAFAMTACASGGQAGTAPSTGTDAGTAPALCAGAGDLRAAGSTAQLNAMQLAITGFQQACGKQVSYNGTGSGAGITSFVNGQVDFAGSDSALNAAKGEPDKARTACGSDAWNLPMITGPIAVAYNLPGVDRLVLDASVAAKIFAGAITTWNDPAIAALNDGVDLPDTRISVFFRSDESGTTENFTDYLHTAAPKDWTQEKSKSWTSSAGQGKAKSAGVSGAVKTTEGGIGYVEWSYAITDQLAMAAIDNGTGAVELTAESAGKAVAAAEIVGAGNDLALTIDYATNTSGAYPIILVTYEIVCSTYADPAKGAAVKAFLGYLTSAGFQDQLTQVGSAPLPEAVASKVAAAVEEIR